VSAPARQTIFVHLAGAVLALAAVASPARAQTADASSVPLTLVRPETLPFSDAELRQALLARLAPRADGVALPPAEVSLSREGAVSVQVGVRSRVVVLGKRTGAGAARVVALVIGEILSVEAEPTAADPVMATTVGRSAAVAPSGPPAAIDEEAPASSAGWPRRLGVTAGAAKGTGDQALWAGTVDVDLVMSPGRGRLRFAPSVGLTVMPAQNVGSFMVDQLSYMGVAVRALGGASFGPVDVFGGPLVSPYSIGGATPNRGVLFGVEATALWAAPLSERLRLVAAGRVDAFEERARVHFFDGQAYATPRVRIGLGIGLACDWSS
jgi:hypothetical protein